jgi:hypothetical protein
MNDASSVTRVSGMGMRLKWLVTPIGRISSYSGWTLVFVEGATTANFIRQPSESVIRRLVDRVGFSFAWAGRRSKPGRRHVR